MSRIGIQPIKLPEDVTVTTQGRAVTVKGEKGELQVILPTSINAETVEGLITVTRTDENKLTRALHGTLRALLQNAVTGVSTGWKRQLDLIGSGYRMNINDSTLELHIGYSHPVHITIPEGLEAKIVKNSIVISGIDRQAVGQFAAVVRSQRKPEPYKGKGIRYRDEHVRRKVGKALKSGE